METPNDCSNTPRLSCTIADEAFSACFYEQNYFLFQYFVFDFNMAPAMLFDKIITLTVQFCYSFPAKYCYLPVISAMVYIDVYRLCLNYM